MLRKATGGLSHLHDPAAIHDGDPAADVAHEPQIVSDEDVCELEPFLQLHQQINHLRLHGHVQGGDGLIGDDERRIQCERSRQADPRA